MTDPSRRFAFSDRANELNEIFGDAQPDYSFDFRGGERPWVWRADDGSTQISERLQSGRDRYYYYDREAPTPYLVRDRDYSYGYQYGSLAVIYDRQGRVLPQEYPEQQANLAGRLLDRGRAICAASRRQRLPVAEANWLALRDQMKAERAQRLAQQHSDQDWRSYHAAHAEEYTMRWKVERFRRVAEAERFATH